MTRVAPALRANRPRIRPRSIAGPEGGRRRLDARPAVTRHIQVDALRVGLLGTLGVGIGLAILGAVSALGTVFVYIGVAFFIALALEPLIKWATRHGMRRWMAALALVLVGAALVAVAAIAIIPTVTAQITHLVTDGPKMVADLMHQPWVEWTAHQFGASTSLDPLLKQVTSYIGDPSRLLSIGGGILAIGSGIASGVTAVIIVTVLTLYFTLTLPQVMATVYETIPRSRRPGFVLITEEILGSVGKYVAGQLALAFANAIVTFIVVTIVGGPVPLLLALVAFVFALIPVVGPVLGTAIIVLATLTVSPLGALVAALVMLIYMQVEAYVLSPRVMAKAVAVPGALVIVAAVGGAALGGVLGALVAIPVVAAGILIFQQVVRPRQELR
jgi:putative heme transporter